MTHLPPDAGPRAERRGIVKSRQDMGAGLFLIALAGAGYVGGFDLDWGRLAVVGPGMMPKSVAVLVAAFGVLFLVQSFLDDGAGLDRWSLRGLVFILGAALLFAWAIRPLGLVVAAPLAIVFSALADRDTRPVEIVVFAAILTTVSVLLFKTLLRLPIPIWPSAIPYPFNQWL